MQKCNPIHHQSYWVWSDCRRPLKGHSKDTRHWWFRWCRISSIFSHHNFGSICPKCLLFFIDIVWHLFRFSFNLFLRDELFYFGTVCKNRSSQIWWDFDHHFRGHEAHALLFIFKLHLFNIIFSKNLFLTIFESRIFESFTDLKLTFIRNCRTFSDFDSDSNNESDQELNLSDINSEPLDPSIPGNHGNIVC